MKDAQTALLEILRRGQENAKKATEIVEELRSFGITDARALSSLVHAARVEGSLICSGSQGYWLPDDQADIRRFYQHMKARALSCFVAAKAARQELMRWQDQILMEEDEGGQLVLREPAKS